ncbi:MAG: hypothetical protein WCR24_07515 [Candidatus Methanomethylophilaceae archaeon]
MPAITKSPNMSKMKVKTTVSGLKNTNAIKIAIDNLDKTPTSQNRKRGDSATKWYTEAVQKSGKQKTVQIKPGMAISYQHSDNLGTKKYPDVRKRAYEGKVTSVGESRIRTTYGHMILPGQIIAVMDGGKVAKAAKPKK